MYNGILAKKACNTNLLVEAAKEFKRILVGDNSDCAIINNVKVCVYLFIDSEVTSDLFTFFNTSNEKSISNYDIVIFIGHGALKEIMTHDLNTRVYIHNFKAARDRTKWIFLYSCQTLNLFDKHENVNSELNDIKKNTFGYDPANPSSLSKVSLRGIVGFYSDVQYICEPTNAIKDFIKLFTKRIKNGEKLPLAWFSLSDKWKGGCYPFFRAKTAEVFIKIYAIKDNKIIEVYNPYLDTLFNLLDHESPSQFYSRMKSVANSFKVVLTYVVWGTLYLEDSPPRLSIKNGTYKVMGKHRTGGWKFSWEKTYAKMY